MTPLSAESLKKVRLFSNLTDEDLGALLPALTLREVENGTVLFNQGDPGDSLFVILNGRFRVLAKADKKSGNSVTQTAEIAEVGAGEVVGELSCIDPAPRSAAVGAAENSSVIELNRNILDSLASYAPQLAMKIIGAIVQRVTERLRMTNDRIETILETRYGQSRPRSGAFTPLAANKGKPLPATQINFKALTDKKNLSKDDIDLLSSQASLKQYEGGQVLCSEGSRGDSCFFIAEGNVQICRNVQGQERILATLPAGSIVGQLALIDREKRSATVRSMGGTKAIELSSDVFESLMAAGSPFAVRFQKEISVAGIRQLRSATQRLASMPSGPAKAKAKSSQKSPAPNSVASGQAKGDNAIAMNYFGAAIGEWDISLADLDQVTVVRPDGLVTQAELKARKLR
jgi:CRP/FNR family transcriptional regulator, cyclic AMP receptor protein